MHGKVFKSVRQKNSQAIISELKDTQGRSFTRYKDLGNICLDFYKDLYKFKKVSNLAISEVFEEFTATFTKAMNECISRDIIVEELDKAIVSMAKEKAPGHDEIPMEFFKKAWHIVEKDYHIMILEGFQKGELYGGVTKGIISLIPKEGDKKDLNY